LAAVRHEHALHAVALRPCRDIAKIDESLRRPAKALVRRGVELRRGRQRVRHGESAESALDRLALHLAHDEYDARALVLAGPALEPEGLVDHGLHGVDDVGIAVYVDDA